MNDLGDIAIIVASMAVIPFAIGLPLLLVPWSRDRSSIGRYLKARLLDDARISFFKRSWGYMVQSCDDANPWCMIFRPIPGGHFYVFENDPEPAELVFCCPDGAMNVHRLPSPALLHGTQLHFHTKLKCSLGMSLTRAALIWLLSIVLGLITFGLYITITLTFVAYPEPSHLYSLIAPIVFLEVVIICFLLAPLWFAVIAYRRNRYERIVSDRPICSECGYDLTGNESGVCPECGTEAT